MVKIVADTTAGLPAEVLRQLDIALIPQIVTFGEQSYRDDREIDTITFWKNSSLLLNCPRQQPRHPDCMPRYLRKLCKKGRM